MSMKTLSFAVLAAGSFALTLSADTVLHGHAATNVLPITSALINQLVAEARTNNPGPVRGLTFNGTVESIDLQNAPLH